MVPDVTDLLEVSVNRLQVVLELGYKLFLSALKCLSVLHPIFEELENAAYAGAESLDAAYGVRKSLQIHTDVYNVRHFLCFYESGAQLWRSVMASEKEKNKFINI